MSHVFARSRRKTLTSVIVAALTVTLGVAIPTAAVAAADTIASGVIRVDANANGAIDSSTEPGANDSPLAGVPMQLVCESPNEVVAETETAADGSYSFSSDDATTCATRVKVRIALTGYASDAYASAEDKTADNDFAPVDPATGDSDFFTANVAAPRVFNGLAAPAWTASTLALRTGTGRDGLHVFTGTNTDPSVTQDPSRSNDVVRSGDLVTYGWSTGFLSPLDRGDVVSSGIFEQTLTLTSGAVVNFSTIPGTCKVGAGATPTSRIMAYPSNTEVAPGAIPPAGTNSLVLTCNLGPIGTSANAISGVRLDTDVRVFSSSENTSSFETSARLYGADAAGVSTIQPSAPVTDAAIIIAAEPRWDVSKKHFMQSSGTRVINGVSMSGYNVNYVVMISTDRDKGVEAPQQPITLTEGMFAQFGSGANSNELLPDFEWYLIDCGLAPAVHGGPGFVGGKIGADGGTAANSVVDSGSCAVAPRTAGDKTSPYELTFSGINTSGSSYPTNYVGTGAATIPAQTYYVASYQVTAFVPTTQIERGDSITGNAVGSIKIGNIVSEFSPVGSSGSANYGAADGSGEPGYCSSSTPTGIGAAVTLPCAQMPDGTRTNNSPDPTTLIISSGYGWNKFLQNPVASWATPSNHLPNATGVNDGRATIQPGGAFGTKIVMTTRDTPLANAGICDVIDGTTAQFSKLSRIVRTQDARYPLPDQSAYVLISGGSPDVGHTGNETAQQALQNNFRIEYGHADLTGDTANNGSFDVTDNRYRGDWSRQKVASCADGGASVSQWYSSPEQVPGGLDAANVVRAVAVEGYSFPANRELNLYVALELRDTYNGGANDGEIIPAGTLSVDFAQTRGGNAPAAWTMNNSYVPQPVNSSWSGGRVTLTRALLSIQKTTTVAKDAAGNDVGATSSAVGETPAVNAGRKVVWKLQSTLTSADAGNTEPVHNVTVTDTLPAHVSYDDTCTAGLVGGTPATTATVNANGTTTLVWNLGTRTPGQPLPAQLICTTTDALAPNDTRATNVATIAADEVAFVPAQQRAEHSVVIKQGGGIQVRKDVDHSIDLIDDEQRYTLRVKNYHASDSYASPTIIDVLPGAGDATNDAGQSRSPASRYVGSSTLTAPPQAFDGSGTVPFDGVFYYTTAPTDEIAQDLNNDANNTWVTTFTPNATAFKFVASKPIGSVGSGNDSGIIITYRTDQSDNDPGDLYANRFTFFSPDLTDRSGYQIYASNQTTVRTAAFSVGDLVWIDEDLDGAFDASVDTVAPAGVPIDVYDSTDAKVASTTTDSAGRWAVDDLAPGSYYAVIPAAQFAEGAPLALLAPAPKPVNDPNTNLNEDVDHHAVSTAAGVRTAGLLELVATRQANGSIVGNGPLGDNVAGLRLAPLTTDDFSNLTLDIALQRVPGYTFTKVASPVSGTPVLPGGTITYTLTGTNTGSSDLAVTITDDLSEVLAYADITTPAAATRGTATVTGDTLSWNGTLTPGQSVTVTYTVTVKADMEGETLRNSATSTATPPAGNPVPPITVETEHPVPGFSLGKSAVPASGTAVRPGEQVTYTITAANTGATELTNVVVNDDLAGVLEHAQLVAGSLTTTLDDGSTVTGAAVNGTTLSWSGTLPIGRTLTISYAVLVDADADANAATLHNRVTAEATPPGLPPITPPPAVTEHPVPGYTFTKISDPATGDTVRAGDTITYTLTGTNTGATALDPVQVSDDLAAVLSYATLVDGSITSSLGAVPTLSGTDLTWSGALAVGEKIVITYAVTVNDGTEGVILHNLASSSATPPGLTPLVPPTVETQHPTPGFTFIKTADPATGTPVFAGETITYSLVARNSGKTVLDPVVISDELAGVTPFSDLVAGSLQATIDGTVVAHPTVKDGVLTWTGVLAEGETVTVTYQVLVREVAASADNIIRNHASASATPPGKPALTPPPVETTHPMPALALDKASNPATGSIVRVGDDVAYTVTLRNTGAADVNGVMMQDDLSGVLGGAKLTTPVTVTIIAADGSKSDAGAVTRDGAVVSKLLSLGVGERAEMTYTVTVTKPNTKLRNVASIAWDGPPSEVPPSETEHIVPPNDPDVIDPPLVPEDPDTEVDPGTPVPPEKPGKPSEPLAVTGAILPVGAAVVAGVLLLGGVLLMVRRRTRRSEG